MRVAFSGVLIAALLVIGWQALGIDGSSAIYPIVVSAGALACSVAFLAPRLGRTPFGSDLPASLRLPARGAARLLAFAIVWIAYVPLLPEYGFILTTWAALALSLAVTRGRPTPGGLLGSAAFVFVFAVLIKSVLYVPVPQGWLDVRLETVLYKLF